MINVGWIYMKTVILIGIAFVKSKNLQYMLIGFLFLGICTKIINELDIYFLADTLDMRLRSQPTFQVCPFCDNIAQ